MEAITQAWALPAKLPELRVLTLRCWARFSGLIYRGL